MEIQWLPITWDAFATFFTGIAAVTGAYLIGRRQTQIQETQLALLERERRFEEDIRRDEIKIHLLEKRQACIRVVRRSAGIYGAHLKFTEDERSDLYNTIQDAELLFPENVIRGLREMTFETVRVQAKYRVQSAKRKDGNLEEADKALDEALELELKIFKALPMLADEMVKHARFSE